MHLVSLVSRSQTCGRIYMAGGSLSLFISSANTVIYITIYNELVTFDHIYVCIWIVLNEKYVAQIFLFTKKHLVADACLSL